MASSATLVKPAETMRASYEVLVDGQEPRATFASFLRLFAVWCSSVICGGITPGQTVFTPLLAEAGLFQDVCSVADKVPCSKQEIIIATVLAGLNLISILSLLPAGIFFDALGARKVSIIGTFIMAFGISLMVFILLLAKSQVGLFVAAVVFIDCGSQMQNFGFYGLLFHLPGWQALLIGLSIGCFSVSAVLPVVLSTLMDATGMSLAWALGVYAIVVCASAGVLALVVPGQAEFFTQAQLVLGLPLPRLKPSLKRVREALGGAWRVLKVRMKEHAFVYVMTISGNMATFVYQNIAVTFGTALFSDRTAGHDLGKVFAQMMAMLGLVAVPFSGVLVDMIGLSGLVGSIAGCLSLVFVFCSSPSWTAQYASSFAAAFFVSSFVVFNTKYIVLFSPPQRFGTVQGVFLLNMFAFLGPCIGIVSTFVSTFPASPLVKYILLTRVFGMIAIVTWGAYAAYIVVRSPPEIVLLEEDEKELCARFGVKCLEDAQEVLALSRKELLRRLASQEPLVQQELLKLTVSEETIQRYSELARRRSEAITTPQLQQLTSEVAVDYTISSGSLTESISVLVEAFGGTKQKSLTNFWQERGEPVSEYFLEPLERNDPQRVSFVASYVEQGVGAGHRFGHALIFKSKATDGSESAEAACICYPPGGLEDGQAVPVGGQRWLYVVNEANEAGGRNLMDLASLKEFDAEVIKRLKAFKSGSGMEKLHKEQPPHWYIALLGVIPGARLNKRGGALLRFVSRLADEAGVHCYLECGEVNVPYYERHGYRTAGSAVITENKSEFVLHGMLRPPEK